MYESHEHHKQAILSQFEEWMIRKYNKGQAENGGKIWEKDGMLNNAIDEAVDLVVYLFTLKAQIEATKAKYDVVDKPPLTEI